MPKVNVAHPACICLIAIMIQITAKLPKEVVTRFLRLKGRPKLIAQEFASSKPALIMQVGETLQPWLPCKQLHLVGEMTTALKM